MDAATLTAFRDRQIQSPDGDRAFLLACQLGKNGPAAQMAFLTARHEARAAQAPDTHQTASRIADRVVELIDLSDPATSTATQEDWEPAEEHWADVRVIAGGDRPYALWLYLVGTEFTGLCGALPTMEELADPSMRVRYADGSGSRLVARVLLHKRPMATVEDGELVCPVCQTRGEIRIKQVAQRISSVLVDEQGLYGRSQGGTSELTPSRIWCQECGCLVRLPAQIEEWT